MKKCIGLGLFGIALGLGLCSGASASGRGLAFGLNAGIGPTVWSYSAYRFGVEAGYRFSTRFGALVEAETGRTTYESATGFSMDYRTSSKMTYTSNPLTLSMHYVTSLNDRAAVYIGLGGGYYRLTLESQATDLYAPGAVTQLSRKVQAFAPHICLGLECAVTGRIVLVGELRQSAGKARVSTADPAGSSEEDLSFGGTQVKIGIRIFVGRSPKE